MSLPISLEMYHQLLGVAAATGFEKIDEQRGG
jgi:hypothetical protein